MLRCERSEPRSTHQGDASAGLRPSRLSPAGFAPQDEGPGRMGRISLIALWQLARVGGELHLDDLVRPRDLAVVALVSLLDLVDDVHARDHLAEKRVLAGERAAALVADEELRV